MGAHPAPFSSEITGACARRVVTFDPSVGFYTSSLSHSATGTDLLARAQASQGWTPEFDFCVDDARVTSLDRGWDLAAIGDGLREDDLAGARVFHLRHPGFDVDVQVGYWCDAHGTSKRYVIRNTGQREITVSRVAIETLPVEIGSPGDLQLDAHYGALPRETYLTGRVDDCAIVLRNPRSGETVIALNEVPGHLKRTETGAWFWEGFVRLMYDTDLFPLTVRLPPGKAWTTAAARLVFARAGDGHSDPRWKMPAATASIRRRSAHTAAWHYNTWDPFGTRIDETTVRELIPLAARMGFEVFTVDDGWQAQYGDNAVCPERFPGGLEQIRDAVEAHGLRLGLWAPLAAIEPALATATPALAAAQSRDRRGLPKMTLTAQGEKTVMCLASDYRPLAAARLNELVERYHLAYLKLDLTTVFNAYGEAPGCYASGHAHGTAGESVARIYTAIADIAHAVYARHPDVLIDLAFELWGQKHTIDYGLLRAADLAWISNVGDNTDDAAGPRQARTLLYQRSLAIPTEAMLIGNLRADTGDPREKFATALGACPLLLGDLRRLTDAQVAWYGEHIRWHRALRKEIDLSQSFFPLGNWRQPSAVEWDGFARLSRAGEGVLVLFRNDAGVTTARVQAPLPGTAVYTLRSVLSRAALGSRSAADFRNGFDLALEDSPVMVIEVRRSGAA